MKLKPERQISDAVLLKKCLFVLGLTMCLFVMHGALGLESATLPCLAPAFYCY